MKNFDLEIRYSHHLKEDDTKQFEPMTSEEVLLKFDRLPWRQQQVIQLQIDGVSASFTLTNPTSEQSLRLTLDGYSATDQLQFKIDSDLQIIIPQKDLFGLITRKTKDYIAFKQLSLSSARAYLLNFLEGNIESLETDYKQSLQKKR